MSPDYPMGWNALGHLLLSQGKRQEAEEVFARATRMAEDMRREQPRTWIAALNVASMRYSQHDVPGALAVLEKARADYPGTWPLSISNRDVTGTGASIPRCVVNIRRPNGGTTAHSLRLAQLFRKRERLKRQSCVLACSRLDATMPTR